MKNTIVARRYAKALLDTALENERLDQVRAELAALVQGIQASPDAARYFGNPLVPASQKEALLEDVLNTLHASAAMRGFVRVAAQKQRLNLLEVIRDEFERLADETAGVLRAKLTSAHELDATSVKRVQEIIEKRTGRHVRLELAVDPSLLGGGAIQLGSRVIDASLKARLRLLRQGLV